jgi:hypothetical protein
MEKLHLSGIDINNLGMQEALAEIYGFIFLVTEELLKTKRRRNERSTLKCVDIRIDIYT